MVNVSSPTGTGAMVFATGGTTARSRIVRHPWVDFEFVCATSADAVKPLFRHHEARSAANCMTAGNLWGGFIFVQELLRINALDCYPFASSCDKQALVDAINEFSIDTVIALPSFAVSLAYAVIRSGNATPSLRTIFYFGESISDTEAKILRAAFGSVQVVPLVFTTQETGPIGYTCRFSESGEYHVFSHVSVIAPQAAESSPGACTVELTYPSGNTFGPHDTGDLVEVARVNCQCGFTGTNVRYISRETYYTNILGTSISAEEVVAALTAAYPGEFNIGKHQVQIVTEVDRGKTSVTLKLAIGTQARVFSEELVSKSTLLRALRDDACSFIIESCSTDQMSVDPRSGKRKFHILRDKTP